jgi:hypothetical protein
LGETNDTLYLQSQSFELLEDDLIVIYGVNHEVTGKAIYANASCYGSDKINGVGGVTSSKVDLGTDAQGNGRSYFGSANTYLESSHSDPNNHLYAFNFYSKKNTCKPRLNPSEGEHYSYMIPHSNEGLHGHKAGKDDSLDRYQDRATSQHVRDDCTDERVVGDAIFIGFRMYVDPVTHLGPYPGKHLKTTLDSRIWRDCVKKKHRVWQDAGPELSDDSDSEVIFDSVMVFSNSMHNELSYKMYIPKK